MDIIFINKNESNANIIKPEEFNAEFNIMNEEQLILEVSVIDYEKKVKQSPISKAQDVYINYLVESRFKNLFSNEYVGETASIWRRYSEFEILRNYLEVIYPFIVIPPLPEKKVSYSSSKLSSDKLNGDFIERRRVGLENFLGRICKHKILCEDIIFKNFLTQHSSRWKESIQATDYQAKAEWKLQLVSASLRLNNPDKQFEAWKNYSNQLQSHISNIIKIRWKIADKVYMTQFLHGEFGRTINELSILDPLIQSAFQAASHSLEIFSHSIDSSLIEEENCIEVLKDYSAYCDSLRFVCRKQEVNQLELEKLEDNLSHKETLKEQLRLGNLNSFSLDGMKMRLFGSDTPDMKEQKTKELEGQISKLQQKFDIAKTNTMQSKNDAKQEIEKFSQQKSQDLNASFKHYADIQISRCKQNINIWQNIRDSFNSI